MTSMAVLDARRARDESTLPRRALKAIWVASCLLALAFLGGASSAHAQAGDAEARALYNAGEIAYGEGRYAAALEYFQRAHELSGRPALLFNIGTTAERLRRDDVALAAFERYLLEVPDAPSRSAVEARIEILRTAMEQHEGTEREVTPAPTDPPTQEDVAEDERGTTGGRSVAPYILLAGGAGVAVLGAVFVGLGAKDASSVEDARDGATWSSVSGDYERAPRHQQIGLALLGVGTAAAVAGIVWAVTGGGSSDDSDSAQDAGGVSGWADRRSAGVVAWGSF